MRTVRPFNIHHAFITAEAIQPVLARVARCEVALLLFSLSTFAAVFAWFPRRSSCAIEHAGFNSRRKLPISRYSRR